jgi:short-subunit dehydrogenase
VGYPRIALDGAVVAVTGGGRGIGRATAELFAAKGALVTLGDFLDEDDAISRTTMNVNVWGLIHGMRLAMPHMIEARRGHIVNVASMAGKLAVPGMAVYNASKFAAVGLTAAVGAEYAHTGVSVSAVLPSAVRTRLSSGVPLGRGMPTVDPEDIARAVVGSVGSRKAEIPVPGYLAGWDLVEAAVPERILSIGMRVLDGRRGLDKVDHAVRDQYERTIREQSK